MQAVRRSPPIAGVPSSRLGYSKWSSWWTKRSVGWFILRVSPFSPITSFIPQFLHIHLIHFVSFNFIHPCDGASGVVRRHPWYSQIFKYRGFIASHSPVSDKELRIINKYNVCPFYSTRNGSPPEFLKCYHLGRPLPLCTGWIKSRSTPCYLKNYAGIGEPEYSSKVQVRCSIFSVCIEDGCHIEIGHLESKSIFLNGKGVVWYIK